MAETPEAFPRSAIEGSLGARFEAMARAHPDRLAVRDRASALTYAELDASANRLGRRVLAERGEGSEPLVILARQDAGAIVAMLAAAKIGKIFVPLDPRQPASRLAAIVRDTEAPLVLSSSEDLDLAREIAGPAVAVLDRDAVDPSGRAAAPGVAVGPGTPLSLFYTSGSTGAPKGLLGSHGLILHRAWAYATTAPVGPVDRLSVLHALSGGGSLRNLWGGLLSGGAVLPYDVARDGLVGLGAWLDREAITICHCAASVFRHFGAALTPADGLAALRLLWVGNEPVLPSDVQLYRDRFPDHCDLVVGLATTEAATVCENRMSKVTRLEEGPVPIGWPIADKEILILGEDGRPVPPGETGELAVRSDFLAIGYWRRPDLDRVAFAPDPEGGPRRICRTGDLARVRADGAVFHLGRKDDVPKVRGQFVDVLEVERVLTAHPAVAVAAVMVREDQPGEGRLVAYVVPASGAVPTVSALRAAAEVALPDHLVPTRVVFLTELPRTANGKVDRKALPAPARARPRLGVPYQAPGTPLEVRIARVWADALDLDGVGVQDPFLDLGGHSLLASRIITRVRDELAVEVPLAALLTAPTVAAMARLVTEALLADLGGRAAEQALADAEGLPPRDGAA